MLQHILIRKVTPRKVTLQWNTARIHKVHQQYKFGVVKTEFITAARTRRVFFGACFLPWRGQWHGLGVSFIPIVHL